MEVRFDANENDDDIIPYSVHVSTKYLELTKRKLELTRLPREAQLPVDHEWTCGVPKSFLEPLIDFWLEKYSWREHENKINEDLPQYRSTITYKKCDGAEATWEQRRVHFVHKRSAVRNAIPLLYCHGWPGSFIEVSKILSPLTSPIPTHLHRAEDSPSFHVVAPSIPGFGFSDASDDIEFGPSDTAAIFNALMLKLGYSRYVVYGSDWCFDVARMLSIRHEEHCLAILTAISSRQGRKLVSMTKSSSYSSPLTSWFQVRPSWLRKRSSSCGTTSQQESEDAPYSFRPHTASFALADSPSGLLAGLVDRIYETGYLNLWTKEDILTWTMLLWLPGPEAPLRWVDAGRKDKSLGTWTSVPLGVRCRGASKSEAKPTWLSRWTHPPTVISCLAASQPVEWVKSALDRVGIPAWDAPSDVILDLRDFCSTGLREGWLKLPNNTEDVLHTEDIPYTDFNDEVTPTQAAVDLSHHGAEHSWFSGKWPWKGRLN